MSIPKGAQVTVVYGRESDGLRFESCYAGVGFGRCECCLAIVPEEAFETHTCEQWWDFDSGPAIYRDPRL